MNKTLKTSWGKSSKWYQKLVGVEGHYYHQQLIIPTVVKMLGLKANDCLLDLGCGQGILARAIRQEVKYLGLDISGSLIEQAKKLNQNPQHEFKVLDVALSSEVFQSIYSHAAIILALQNMRNPEKVIANVALALKKGGKLLIVLNHPCFRIPRQTGWDVDQSNKQQKRWINRYMSPMEIPILTHPSNRLSTKTWSFHFPLSSYVNWLSQYGLCVTEMKELVSDKESVGKAATMENRSRAEIPLFMIIKAVKRA